MNTSWQIMTNFSSSPARGVPDLENSKTLALHSVVVHSQAASGVGEGFLATAPWFCPCGGGPFAPAFCCSLLSIKRLCDGMRCGSMGSPGVLLSCLSLQLSLVSASGMLPIQCLVHRQMCSAACHTSAPHCPSQATSVEQRVVRSSPVRWLAWGPWSTGSTPVQLRELYTPISQTLCLSVQVIGFT